MNELARIFDDPGLRFNWRHFFSRTSLGLGGAALGSLLCYGATDPFGYSVAAAGVHVNDFHATILFLLGIDHERLTYKHQGRYYRLTDVSGKVVKGIIA